MFRSLKRQRGLGWFGWLFVFGVIGFTAIVTVKVGPIFMNHMTVMKIVKSVADNADYADAPPEEIRKTLERRWDVDYVNYVDDKEIKIKRGPKGRMLSYDYKAEVNLFYNIFVVVKFKDDFPMKPGSGDIDS